MVDGLFPIYIPSKGRAATSKTIAGLEGASIPYTVFVEPQDMASYMPAVTIGNIEQLPKNDMGIGYARQAIHNYARGNRGSWYWMLDDDIQSIYTVESGRCIKGNWKDLEKAQRVFYRLPNVAQAGIEYQQFAWSASKPIIWNSYCNACTCINSDLTKFINFNAEYKLKEDLDFTLQVLASGLHTVRLTQYAFSSPGLGSNRGGLHDIYAKEIRMLEENNKLANKWGKDICTVIRKRNGRIDTKINWRYFNNGQKIGA